ncbi:MAG: hypothetical protein PHH54_04155 [Candidatus Nanoarchaeia archaeon]|nr:hypothetical protein [Candidatus Nanoarchaeia archaeon]MDD5741153.1 hypothetical protein [Candidatus Nanoarchaeia archaeon]
MELTTENIIKIALGVFVIVMLILGIYLAMRSYIIPYFSGIGFEEPKVDINSQFGKELVQEKNLVGTVDEKGYFVYKGVKTEIYFQKDKIYVKEYGVFNWDWTNPDEEIGKLDSEGKITIKINSQYSDNLKEAYKVGKEIYKIK